MTGYKISNVNDMTVVTYKQKGMLRLDHRDISIIEKQELNCLMKPKWLTSEEMQFEGPISISLKKYLSKDCNVSKIYNVFRRIIAVLKQVEDNHLSKQKLIFDTKYIFVREMSGEIYFIYEPYIETTSNGDCKNLFMNIFSIAKIRDKNQLDELRQFKEFVMKHNSYDELEDYIKKKEYGDTSKSFSQNDYEYDEGTTLLGQEDEGTMLLSTSLGADSETTLLKREPVLKLIRKCNNSEMNLSMGQTTIGRSSSNMITISDNTNISRIHAVISATLNDFTIMDRGSKNGTVVNGKTIFANSPEPISNGDVIIFGGEEFIFVVEE